MSNRFHNPRPQFMNATPVVYSAGVLRFYASGTSTPLNVYANSDLTSGSTSVTLNSAGRPSQDIFLSDLLYKVTLEDALGNIIYTVDPYFTSDYSARAKVTGYSGNPNGFVAGTASAGAIPADMVWDRTNRILYVCVTTGVAAAAVWVAANTSTGLTNWTTAGRNVSPTEGVDFGYNTTLHALEYWNATRWVTLAQANPTVQRFTSGSGNYTTPANVRYIKVTMCGPGGGGGATTTNAGANGSANTSFGAWTAVLGSGGATSAGATSGGAGGTGGTDVADASNKLIVRHDGGNGEGRDIAASTGPGGMGGANHFGGAGAGAANAAGGNAKANTGGGGAGGGGNSGVSSGAAGNGGGAGEHVAFYVFPTAAQVLAYVVGAGGAGGAAGTQAGGNGAAGIIIVEEFYQ